MNVRVMSPSLPLRRLACVVGLLSSAALGCLESREQPAPNPADNDCAASCHGNRKTPMPPPDTRGGTDPSSPGVGAHALHVAVPSIAGSCNTCHVVPTTVEQKGHADDGPPGDVRFAEFAVTKERQPTYDPTARTCGNTYCHSGPGTAGIAPWPAEAVWTQPRSSEAACGSSCHALPPAGKHPASSNCVNCHADTVDAENKIKNAALHINGTVNVGQMACSSCHGSEQSSAPPKDLAGNTDTTSIGVGAHQKHLAGGEKTRPLACTECHKVPSTVDEPGHIDTDAPAELSFSGVGTSNNSNPSWDRTQASCTNTWCHGRAGGTSQAPIWNQVDGKQASCGGCHGISPAAPHPENAFNCEYCHHDNAGPGLAIKDRNRHVDGKVDFAEGCTTCHGFPPAPALNGATEATDIGVGAHAAHLAGNNSRALACTECHVIPSEVLAPGHIDTAIPAELAFTGVGLTDNHTPVWDHASATCTASYCHGSAAWGGSNPAPIWNQANQAECGSCHGIPPAAPHPQNATNCEYCHRDTAGPGLTFKDKNRHVDGKLDFATNADCTTCHGNPPAPSLSGATQTSDIGVGAHKAHLEGGVFSRKVACNECHVVPADMFAPGHLDTGMPADLTFSGVAVTENLPPLWDHATATCTNSYCHGGGLKGGTNPNPVWTQAAQAACGSCHGLPPPLPHPNIADCSMCHGTVVNAQMQIVDREKHINGKVDF